MSAVLLDYSEILPVSEKLRPAGPQIETYSYVEARTASPVTPAILPLFSFLVDGDLKRLIRPLRLRVIVEDGEYFVENDSLRLFGHGSTLHTAMGSFLHDLAYCWQYYRELSQEQVSGEAVQLKRRYEELVA